MAPFCSCPASLVSRKFFAVGPGCAKCFFFCCAPLGAATFRRGQSKKKTPPRVFFFLLRPRERQGKEKPRADTGTEQKKKHHPGCFFFFFFAAAPAKGKGRRSPVGRRHGARAKKKTPPRVFFFCSGPGGGRGGRSPCRHGASPSLPFPGAGAKKNTLGGVFFLLRPRADAHSLTAGLGGDASPSPGWCFLFAAAAPGPGWCFFFFAVAPPGRSLTHCGLGRFRQGPGGVFFLLRPRRVFLDDSKKCLGYYIGSKKTRRGHSKKKNTTSPLNPKP